MTSHVSRRKRSLWDRIFRSPRFKASAPRRFSCEPLEARQMLAANIIISEVFYQPPGSASNERQDEWVEVYNSGDADANLRGWTLSAVASGGVTENILYSRPNTPAGNFFVPPGGYAIIAANINRPQYGPIPKIGNTTSWTTAAGNLDNAGGRIILRDNSTAQGRLVAQIDYLDEAPWPVVADGFGASMRVIDPLETFNPFDLSGGLYDPENWTSSIERGGSPAAAGLPTGPGVVFNEILASSNDNAVPPELDQIELYNTTDTTIDISNWFLTDHDNTAEGTATAAELQRYVFPAGTTIGPHGYLVIDESQFGAGLNGFGLNGTEGDQILLVNPLAAPVIFSDVVAFEASEESVSYGRIPAGQGLPIPNAAQSFGGENSAHKQSDIVISEVMYAPPSDNPLLEYIELLNQGTTTIDLHAPAIGNAGWRLRANIDFDFPVGTTLAPGERLIIVPFNPSDTTSRTIFENTYGVKLNSGTGTVIKAVGGHGDDLSDNNGELELQERVLVGLNDFGQMVYDFIQRDFLQYRDSGDWPGRADGLGASLERIDPTLYANSAESWRGSAEYNGTPGTAPNPGKTVVINEVLAHTDPPYYDSFELYNPTSEPVDIGNWWVTEDVTPIDVHPSVRFTIPAGTILPPGGYITFNNDPSQPVRFTYGLKAAENGNLYLLQTQNDRIVRFADNIGYPASFNAELSGATFSLGRWPNGTGTMFPTQSITLKNSFDPVKPGQIYMDGANSGPRIGDIDRTVDPSDVIISEVMYNAGTNVEGTDSLEYIELYNPTGSPIDLGPLPEPDADLWPLPPSGWRLNKAVEYDFKAGEVVPAQGTILVVGFDPTNPLDASKLAAFQARYGLSGSERIVGPFAFGEHISDYGGNIELEANDFAQGTLPSTEKFTPNVLVDGVRYDDAAPWPTSAAGGGHSLTRRLPAEFGDFPSSWEAADPTPGSVGPPTSSGAPQVSKVVVWGDGWSQEFRTEISDPGTVGASGYSIPGGATQSTVLPWTGINQISVIFSEDVEIDSDALAVRGVSTSNYLAGSNPTYNGSTWTATWQLSQPIGRDRVVLDLQSARVRDIEGNDLDGEWTDAVSSYPSGNGTEGGDFEMRFNVLPGDADRNGTVGQDDFTDVRTALFLRVADSGYDAFRDISGNGKIAAQDWVMVRNNLGQTLPSGSPSPEPGAAAAAIAVDRPAGREVERLSATRIRGARQAGLAAGAVDRAFTLQPTESSPSDSLSRLRARASRSPQIGTDGVLPGTE